MSSMECKPRKICIIGAGNVGLMYLRTFLKKGHDVTCFEERSNIGGMWNFEVKPGEENLGFSHLTADGTTSCAYNNLNLNTSKILFFNSDILKTGLDLFPDKIWLQWQEVLEMLNKWATMADIYPNIKLNTKVLKLTKTNKYWSVKYKGQGDDDIKNEEFDFIICCTGGFRYQNMPEIKKMESFKRTAIHSSQVRLEKDLYPGKNVLVFGASFSGTDVVQNALQNKAKKIYWSESRNPEKAGHWIVDNSPNLINPKYAYDIGVNRYMLFDRPDLLQIHMKSVCTPLHEFNQGKDIILPRDQLGVGSPSYIQEQMKNGRLQLIGPVSAMTKSGAITKSRQIIDDIDVVIYSTGYKPKFPLLDEFLTEDEQSKSELYYHILPVQEGLDGLAIAGICDAQEGLVTMYELQARWLCKFWLNRDYDNEGKLFTDEERHNMKEAIETVKIAKQTANKKFYFIENPFVMFDTFANEIGCLPRDYRELIRKGTTKEDVELGIALMKGPVYSMQYRLTGEDSYEEAAEYLINVAKTQLGLNEFDSMVRSAMGDPQEFLKSQGVVKHSYMVEPCFPSVFNT